MSLLKSIGFWLLEPLPVWYVWFLHRTHQSFLLLFPAFTSAALYKLILRIYRCSVSGVLTPEILFFLVLVKAPPLPPRLFCVPFCICLSEGLPSHLVCIYSSQWGCRCTLRVYFAHFERNLTAGAPLTLVCTWRLLSTHLLSHVSVWPCEPVKCWCNRSVTILWSTWKIQTFLYFMNGLRLFTFWIITGASLYKPCKL